MKQKILFLICGILISINASARVGVYCFFSTSPSSEYSDDNVDVFIGVTQLCIYNKTDKVIYFDRASSFAYKNGLPTCIYNNTSYTEGKTKGHGGSVNLGGIANVIGIHGAAGTILNGVNVGGGISNEYSTTYYEQKIVAIAPHSVCYAYKWEFDPEWDLYIRGLTTITAFSKASYIDPITKIKTKFKKGQNWHYDESSTPLKLEGVINYSLNQDLSDPIQATVRNYISDLVIGSYKGIDKSPQCIPYRNQDYVSFISGSGKWPWITLLSFAVGTVAVSYILASI